MSDLIKREDAIAVLYRNTPFDADGIALLDKCEAEIKALPSADRPQGEWIDKAIDIIDDMQREGIVDYQVAWEFRMKARMKGADDEMR